MSEARTDIGKWLSRGNTVRKQGPPWIAPSTDN